MNDQQSLVDPTDRLWVSMQETIDRWDFHQPNGFIGGKYNPRNMVEQRLDDILDTVYHGDVMDLLRRLPPNSIDMVYADPDYNVGIKYNDNSYTKKHEEYIDWCISWANESMRVLKPTGNMFIINYPKNNAYLRVRFLDGACYDVQEYVWTYNTNVGQSTRRLTTAHRSILHCTKSKKNQFYKDAIAVPYQNPTDKRIKRLIENGSKGRMPYSWFYFDLVKNVSREKTYHSCQIPQKLSEMLIRSCTKPGDNMLILFGGSGSEILVARRIGRHFISAEIDENYHRMILDLIDSNGEIDEKYRLPM